jgi:hypothetical protein
MATTLPRSTTLSHLTVTRFCSPTGAREQGARTGISGSSKEQGQAFRTAPAPLACRPTRAAPLNMARPIPTGRPISNDSGLPQMSDGSAPEGSGDRVPGTQYSIARCKRGFRGHNTQLPVASEHASLGPRHGKRNGEAKSCGERNGSANRSGLMLWWPRGSGSQPQSSAARDLLSRSRTSSATSAYPRD